MDVDKAINLDSSEELRKLYSDLHKTGLDEPNFDSLIILERGIFCAIHQINSKFQLPLTLNDEVELQVQLNPPKSSMNKNKAIKKSKPKRKIDNKIKDKNESIPNQESHIQDSRFKI